MKYFGNNFVDLFVLNLWKIRKKSRTHLNIAQECGFPVENLINQQLINHFSLRNPENLFVWSFKIDTRGYWVRWFWNSSPTNIFFSFFSVSAFQFNQYCRRKNCYEWLFVRSFLKVFRKEKCSWKICFMITIAKHILEKYAFFIWTYSTYFSGWDEWLAVDLYVYEMINTFGAYPYLGGIRHDSLAGVENP